MARVKKTETSSKIEELAKKIPLFEYLIPQLKEGDELNLISGSGLMGPAPVGFTKQTAQKVVLDKLFGTKPFSQKTGNLAYPLLPIPSNYGYLRDELTKLLRVVGVTPKKAISHVKEFTLEPGKKTTGIYTPEAIRVFESEFDSPMSASFAHEAGHGASIPMFGKVLKKAGYNRADQSTAGVGMAAYESYLPELEGVAEYLGQHIQKKAGLEQNIMFGHGAEQREVFKKLLEMPSKNPYMNVYRYMQTIVR
jgi:hypothetical protein